MFFAITSACSQTSSQKHMRNYISFTRRCNLHLLKSATWWTNVAKTKLLGFNTFGKFSFPPIFIITQKIK